MLTPVYILLLLLTLFLIFIQNCTGFRFTFDVQLKAGATWWNGYARNILVYERDSSIVCTSKDGNRVHSISDVFDYTCGYYHLYWDGSQNTVNEKFYMTLMMMWEREFGTEWMLVMLNLKRVMTALLLNVISRFS